MNQITRTVLTALGVLCVVLALIGIFVPVLPTTPFLLLAAGLFARSSQRFYDWLLNNRLFGTYIRNYREGKGATLRHKIAALVLLWGTIGASAVWWVEAWWVRLLLLGIASAVTLHLVKMPTYRPGKEG
jgi:uncharacterized membrane protein YbaN (DUF454 family)